MGAMAAADEHHRDETYSMKVLVTGGAGFIGTHLTRRLLRADCSVTVLDNFSPQIHGGEQALAPDIASQVELFRGDVRDRDLLSRALVGQQVLVHLAAETGTGQSMYEVGRYQDVNIGGTASIIDCLMRQNRLEITRLVLASSRAIYGEGKYRCAEHGVVYPDQRQVSDMLAGKFDPFCSHCRRACKPEPTDEDSPPRPISFYGLTKHVQEQMLSLFARSRGISFCALRYQNVYGPGQSLRNPYTGILAIFSGLARAGSPIQIFEDGMETRDFVSVEDVVEATWLAITDPENRIDEFNVGTGQGVTVLEVATEIARYLGKDSQISITGAFRQGDIRHNFADISKIRDATGFEAKTGFREGVRRFLAWVSTQDPQQLNFAASLREMSDRGLLNGG